MKTPAERFDEWMERMKKKHAGAFSRKVQPLVRLEIDVEIPVDYGPTEDDVKEWIEYWTGNRKYIARENPLCYLGIKGKILKYEPNDLGEFR